VSGPLKFIAVKSLFQLLFYVAILFFSLKNRMSDNTSLK